MQATVAGLSGRSHRSRFSNSRRSVVQAEGNELVENLLTGMQGRHARHGRKGQGHPSGADAIAQLNAVIAIAERNRQIPLGAVAIDGNFLEGVGMGAAVLHAGHISKAKAEAAGPFFLSPLAIVVGDLPKHVGPLGITGQEDHAGLGCGECRWG